MKVEFEIKDEQAIKFFEKQKEIEERRTGEKKTNSEIAHDLVITGVLRRTAARKWAKNHAPEPKPRKPKAPKAKKVKAAKAKGPLARKQASKAKPPRVRKAPVAAAPAAVAEKPAAEVAPLD